jgi:hypothetical protein
MFTLALLSLSLCLPAAAAVARDSERVFSFLYIFWKRQHSAVYENIYY